MSHFTQFLGAVCNFIRAIFACHILKSRVVCDSSQCAIQKAALDMPIGQPHNIEKDITQHNTRSPWAARQ